MITKAKKERIDQHMDQDMDINKPRRTLVIHDENQIEIASIFWQYVSYIYKG